MKKGLIAFVALLALGFVLNTVNKPQTVTAPVSQEELAKREEAQKKAEAQKAYFAHPVIRARETARKLEAINTNQSGPIAEAVQSVRAYATSKGQQPINAHLVGNAALAFDSMAKAYAAFDVPSDLPGKATALLTGARVRLKESAEAGTLAFLDLQRLLEAKGNANMKSVSVNLDKAITLRNEGVQWLENAKKELAGMDAPEWVK